MKEYYGLRRFGKDASSLQMSTHTDIERGIDPFSYNTLHFEVWALVSIPIQPRLIDKIYEKLLLYIFKNYCWDMKIDRCYPETTNYYG